MKQLFITKTRWLVTIILLITFAIGQMLAAKYTWTYASGNQWLFSSDNKSPGKASGTATLNSVDWSYDRGTPRYLGTGNSSIQFGSNGNVETPTFTCSAYSSGYTITEVSVKTSSYNGKHKVAIKVGGSSVKSATATSTPTSSATAITSGAISTSGNVEIIFSSTSGARALYVQSFSITYCKLPTSLTNGEITSSTAHLSWSDTDSPGKYQVYCSTSSSTPTANATPTATVTTKYVDLESLTSSQTYYWWVRAYDETNSSKSAWVAGTSFTTESSGSSVTLSKAATTNGSFSRTVFYRLYAFL